MSSDLRLIEDYLPIAAISKEATREMSVRKGHIAKLHLWWARRPLVACRAAVYGALVPADRFRPKNGPEEKRASLGRANAAEFVEGLCKYPGDPKTIQEAQRHILEAHADRLTEELAQALKLPLPPAGEGWGEGAPAWLTEFNWPRHKTTVTYEDIVEGRAPRPRVLDMFAGGGSIVPACDQTEASEDACSTWGALADEPDRHVRRQSEPAAEQKVSGALVEEGFPENPIDRVGHLKLGFDIRAHRVTDHATGEVEVRRIEVKGRMRGQPVRLTTNEWYKAQQLTETDWVAGVWDPLGDRPELVTIRNEAARLDHAKREIVAARFYEIPAEAIVAADAARMKQE